MFDTPILYLFFNRPDLTEITFSSICKIKPKNLFIAADGPRIGNHNDEINCKIVREYVLSKIDWECEVKTLFRDENLGCGKAVSSAISWFFEHVDEGIILEDDCLPNLSFFQFSEEMLLRYRNENRVMIVSGTNPISSYFLINDSYTFTASAGIWGWATWKRAWNFYDFNIQEWKSLKIQSQFKEYFHYAEDAENLSNGLDAVSSGAIDTWDYQWAFYRVINDGIGIVPKYNLISNVGFGINSTHTDDPNHYLANLYTVSLGFPLIHPEIILSNSKYSKALNEFMFPKLEVKKFTKSNKILNLFLRLKNYCN